MNRLDETFSKLRERREKAFVAYVAAGDPDFERSLEVIRALADAGADVIELGVPFSDPLADGIVNQMAAARALEAGMDTSKVLELIRKFRETHQTPVVLFTYLNPVYAYGFAAFQRDAAEAGADGILLLDLPPDETGSGEEFSGSDALYPIRLIAPTTPAERMARLAKNARGFIYALSRTGVTGAKAGGPSAHIAELVASIKKHTKTPVCVGFGISTPEQAATVADAADGAVVGSALVQQIAQNPANPAQAVKIFANPLISATKS
jgi:tryptophan synthase alpha chain